MTNKKTMKRSLITSIVAMLICISMFAGTTFAWFTDSVTSSGNVIKTGTLDVALYYADGTQDPTSVTWEDASAEAIFDYDNWEPGYTVAKHLMVSNEGTLDLKYQLAIVPDGEVSKLAEVIDVYYIAGGQQIDERTDLTTGNYRGTLADLISTGIADGNLYADGEKNYVATIVLKMNETAGNEYQNLSIGDSFSVKLFATQLTSENDSFNNQYDAMATIDTETELLAALAADYDLIELGANIALTNSVVIPASKTVTIDLHGYTISQTKDCTETYSMIDNKGNLTINDSVGTGKISFTQLGVGGDSSWATYTIRNNGTLVVNGGTVEHQGNQAGNANNAIFSYSGDTTINGGYISCPYSRSVRQWNGTLTINGGTFDGQVWVQPQNDCTTTITGGSFKPGSKGGDYSSVFVTNDTKTVALSVSGGYFATKLGMSNAVKCVTGGTFAVDPSAYVADGLKAVPVGDVYEIILETTTYATASTATELQAALDNASNVNLIVLTADIEGDVTAKQISDLDITINGADHKYAGVILVDGNSATEMTSSITLKNINFVADSISADACVQLGNGTTVTRYTCNVTVENCTFDVPGAVGIKSYTGGDKNLKIVNCTATAKAHSMAQLKGIDGVTVERCTVNAVRGINLNNSLNVTVKDSTFDVQKYAVRFGESANTTVENYAIINSTIASDNIDGDAAIVLRAGATNANLTLTNTTITAGIEMSGHENANVVIN